MSLFLCTSRALAASLGLVMLLLHPSAAAAQRDGGPDRPPPMQGSDRDRPRPGVGPPLERRGPFLGPPGRFWDDKHIARDIGLRPEQQRKMDEIFAAGRPLLSALLDTLRAEEARVALLTPEDRLDESKVFAALDRLAHARAELEKANAHVLILIRRELDAAQLVRLERLRNGPPPDGP